MAGVLKARDLRKLGLRDSEVQVVARRACREAARAGLDREAQQEAIRKILAGPLLLAEHAIWGPLARLLAVGSRPAPSIAGAADGPSAPRRRGGEAPWRQWGTDLDPQAVQQMRDAVSLPVAAAGALMPDAHVGYGLPIGGVLATDGVVFPYAVGVDIACRMRLTVVDWPADSLESRRDDLRAAILSQTRFGVGAAFAAGERRDHAVLEADWARGPVTRRLRDLAWSQLGTSGSGNHFVEFGRLTLPQPDLGLAAGVYLALLSHSGSRRPGLEVADHYARLAAALHRGVTGARRHLAWFDLRSEPGQEYWAAMQLMGRYAAANHELIHAAVLGALGARRLAVVENHHNFAWLETHGGRQVVVHRKGATPAGAGDLGVIPGSMATPGWVVRGLGSAASLRSASHGAGRSLSRTEAKRRLQRAEVCELLQRRGVELLGAGLDEAPQAYKDITQVMAAQADLVQPIARFDPVLVRMAGGNLTR
ncbi:MAG: RtcB family protein [Candidatus Krumholzibacteria bacterium]|nr:RtcB family protein [Candidatus Krumholzibacteria bacterium]